MSRWIRFFIAILIGTGLGLLYGWVISPIEYIDTAPGTLRVDYRTDYVLMVAETFSSESDVDLAVRRLGLLGEAPPIELVESAITFAQKAGYTDNDLDLLQVLLNAIQAYTIAQETPSP